MEKNQVIIIPCYNEIKTILSIYNKAKKFGRVVIVDDFSDDGTRKFLKEKKIFFIKNKKNCGYEKTLINGFKYAIRTYKNAEYILTIDADNELPTKYISKIQKKIKNDKAQIVIGKRNQFNRYTEKLISMIFKNLFDVDDPLSGLKIYKKSFIKKYIELVSKNLFLVDLIFFCKSEGAKISEFKINVNRRKDRARVGSNINVNLKIMIICLRVIIKIIINYLNFKTLK